ncbi:MAG TPA: 3-oxoacyl-[acyl-carrier-protein] synthase III C-terminal domain-containing protein [Polyangiaceae bacterium]|nr:3-oxoacyl-[acyl-carrier-protein] synthase III C-terminal domain-containing protein [Polyangiaceae bacterium]
MQAIGLNARRDASYASEIVASAYAYPSEAVDNAEYLRRCRFVPSSSAESLALETRMSTRRWCLPQENTATLCENLVERLLTQHGQPMTEIDAVIVASGTTMTMAHPSDPSNVAYADLAPLILRQLGRTDALGLDIKACYCSGFLRGLQVADSLLANPNYRSVLLVAAEQGSRFATAASNRSSFCYIVGDAAGGMVLRRVAPRSRVGILDYCGYTDVAKLAWVGIGEDAASIIMLGSRAADATQGMLLEMAHTLLSRNGLSVGDIDWLLPIQTHAGLLEEVRRRLEWPTEKLLWRGDVNGFSGSASIPSCFAEQVEQGRIQKGQLVLSLAVGAGMNCAGALYYA